jgi:O-acetyl-ADP-ribose deacetylase
VRRRVETLRGDITTQQVDAIVNAANRSLLGGGGVDGAIHRAAGPDLLIACREVRRDAYPDGLPVGDAVATAGGNLAARWVIHTVGPNWHRGQRDPQLLRRCITRSLDVAGEVGARSVAFPAVSAGAYGWNPAVVARIAVRRCTTRSAGLGWSWFGSCSSTTRSPTSSRAPSPPGGVTRQARRVSTTERSNLHDLERELTRFFRRSRVASTAIAAEVHPDLDVASYTVLVTISDLSGSLPGGVRAIDVAETLGLHKSTMSRNIAVLEGLGLVAREPSVEDARARILTITEPGRRSLDAAVTARRQRVSTTLSRWSEADVRDLARLLGQLNDDLS